MNTKQNICLSGLKKTYASRIVLDIPQFEFALGQRYALIGVNGSGKSTLLRLLAGFLAADQGQIDYPAELLTKQGFMPQEPYAYGFSVLRNVLIAVADLPRLEARAQALAALDQVGLGHLAQASGARLSGGEKQRMALARMIALPRQLLLLDEPTSAMDIAGNDCVEAILQAYCQANGCTLIFATHSLAQAERLADQVLILEQGQIVESGTTSQVLYQPQSAAGQRFVRHWRLG